jgi:hypothetical protein
VVVSVLRCTARGCKIESGGFETADGIAGVSAVAGFSGRVVVAYQPSSGETRARIAALNTLGAAMAPPLFDSDRFGGPLTKALRVILTEAGAYVLPDAADSRVAFVDKSGTVSAVRAD